MGVHGDGLTPQAAGLQTYRGVPGLLLGIQIVFLGSVGHQT
ncbi:MULTISPECIES: hypothetical protein [unclassified Microcoleus]